MLFPKSIDDYVPPNHLSRMISNIVEQLDTKNIEDKYSPLGQNTYPPKIMIKLLFYGYAIGERSGRKISAKCETDTAYIYLAQMYKPDFRTINDFRKNNLEELSKYFIDIVRMCKELGLISVGQMNIDGTKIKASAANRRTKTKEDYQKDKNTGDGSLYPYTDERETKSN
jgi:transposase